MSGCLSKTTPFQWWMKLVLWSLEYTKPPLKTKMTMENPIISRCISYKKWWISHCHVNYLLGVNEINVAWWNKTLGLATSPFIWVFPLLGCPRKLGSMDYNLLINGIYWGYNPLILTIDPNFQPDIQVNHPLRKWSAVWSGGVIPSLKLTARTWNTGVWKMIFLGGMPTARCYKYVSFGECRMHQFILTGLIILSQSNGESCQPRCFLGNPGNP